MNTYRIAMGLEYRGTAYCGWQSQPSGCAVQDHVESALAKFLATDARVSVICAGRTDTGVHASQQVIHLDTDIARDEQAWVRGTNTHLPADIRVLWAKQIANEHAEAFHARFAARSRRYRYVVLNRAVAPALHYDLVGWFHAPLSLSAMQDAAQSLLGEHDFSAFRSSECQAKTPVKTLYALNISQVGDVFIFDLHANAFLHHMVRNIVGSLVYVGAGRNDVAWMRALLDSRDRARAAPTFAAAGLTLTGIEYDAKFGLPNTECPPTGGQLQALMLGDARG
jgi:tRNA pseudouridine38-40 synthase